VPVLKPGKPAGSGSSYWPILLLSPAAKVLERLLLPMVTEALPKSISQHGFAPANSCTAALLLIAMRVTIGFNDDKPASSSAFCAVEISKAFYSINPTLLIEHIVASTLHPSLIRWLSAYIRGRTAYCTYGSALSPLMVLRLGVPQGSVLSPALFNFFCSNCPTFSPFMLPTSLPLNPVLIFLRSAGNCKIVFLLFLIGQIRRNCPLS
jgi:hypothetical protein